MAIELSELQLKTKCHALCQRGVLHRKQENLDAARLDFEAAAKLGSKFAKTQVRSFSFRQIVKEFLNMHHLVVPYTLLINSVNYNLNESSSYLHSPLIIS